MPVPPGGDDASREPRGSKRGYTPAEIEAIKRARDEFAEVQKRLQNVRSAINTDDVLLRLRKQQVADLGASVRECEEHIEQSHTWTLALEEVHSKRQKKSDDHTAKVAKSGEALAKFAADLEAIEEEAKSEASKHAWAQVTFSNGAKVEQKTIELWSELEEELRTLFKESEAQSGEKQRNLLIITKRQQDLIIGSQEVARKLQAQENVLGDVVKEGVQLQAYWKSELRDAAARVNLAKAEVEAEEKARNHLVAHGDRIRGKLEISTGNLTAQTMIMDDQSAMDSSLKAESEEIERQIRKVQLEIDEEEEHKRTLEKNKEEMTAQAMDKIEHLNAQLRAIETSAGAVATEQAIAQRTLLASEETLETLDVQDARARLQEDVDALRTSLTQIETRLHEVHVERAAIRESRARTQKEVTVMTREIEDKMSQVDKAVERLLQRRVVLESDQRETDGKRVVAHARVKQSRKSIAPLEQERKLYMAELEWVREFEEHSFLRMQEKQQVKVKLQKELDALRAQGGQQLKDQAEDESILRDGIKALVELQEKIGMHTKHVEANAAVLKHEIALGEAESASIQATLMALDGKQAEAEEATEELEERRQAEQADYEQMEGDRKQRKKELSGKQRKEQRINAQLGEASKAIQAELDEVLSQLREQRQAAMNSAAQATSLRGEIEAVDRQIRETEMRVEMHCLEEDDLQESLARLRIEMHPEGRKSKRNSTAGQ